MLAFAIDRGDQFRKGRAALLGDLFQTVPELAFKADARLVACNDNRALRNQRLHGFSPANEPSVLYDRMALRGKKHGLAAATPSRTSQTDQALTLYIWLSIVDFCARDHAPSSEYLVHHSQAYTMPQHMRVNLKRKLSSYAGTLDHSQKPRCCNRSASFGNEYIRARSLEWP